MSEAVLEVKELKTAIKDKRTEKTIIDLISFEIGPKEVVALVGESGCGKSMTSLSIMQLLPGAGAIAEGEIRFRGRKLVGIGDRDMSQIRGRQIAMIFQEPMTCLIRC